MQSNELQILNRHILLESIGVDEHIDILKETAWEIAFTEPAASHFLILPGARPEPMTQKIPDQIPKPSSYRTDHMANERTFLAWIRTCIGIMAFGFVLEKFGVFLHKLTELLERGQGPLSSLTASYKAEEYSSIFGLFIVCLSMLLSILAFIKYKRVERQIEENLYHPSLLIDSMLILAVLSIGLFLVYYLKLSL